MITPPGLEEVVAAFGLKPSDYDPTAFPGIHDRYVLVILDEACGIPGSGPETSQSLWDAADSLLTNNDCRELAVGNPDYANSEFAKVCKPGSGWNVLSINAFETPNFTKEPIPEALSQVLVGRTWVEEKRKQWVPSWYWVDANDNRTSSDQGILCVPPEGEKVEESHPLWLSKVMGIFPENVNALGLIPITWVEAAQERSLPSEDPDEFGVDCGAGGDATVVARRRGPVVRIISEDHNPDTMETTGRIISLRRDALAPETKIPLGTSSGTLLVKIDKIGIGAGILDRANEQGEGFVGVNVGIKPNDEEKFLNFRAEAYWHLRELFETGNIDLDPNDAETAAEIVSLRYKRTSKGQIQIESKDSSRRRGVASPNRAEAIMLAFCDPIPDESLKRGGLLW
jgi:hypothetical protein